MNFCRTFNDEDLLASIWKAFEWDIQDRSQPKETSEARERYATLTPREKQVMRKGGGPVQQTVAYELGISQCTVEIHRGSVMSNMGADSVASLVKMMMTIPKE